MRRVMLKNKMYLSISWRFIKKRTMEAENNSRFNAAICGDTGFQRYLYKE